MGMQSMIFYVAATLIGFVALLLLSVVLLRGQEQSVDTTQFLRAKSSLFAAIQNIELDFRNIGGGKEDVSTAFPPSGIDTLACTNFGRANCRFSFYGRVDPTSADSSLVQYFWRRSGSEMVDTDLSGSVDNLVKTWTYTLQRVVDGSPRFVIDRVSRFRVSVFDSSGVATANTLAVRQIEVELSILVPTTQTDEQLEAVTWRSVFRPVNLTRN